MGCVRPLVMTVPVPRRKIVPDPQAGAGEISAIGWHSLARNETLVATGHADGRVLLLLVGRGPTGPPLQESISSEESSLGPDRLADPNTAVVHCNCHVCSACDNKFVRMSINSRITRVLLSTEACELRITSWLVNSRQRGYNRHQHFAAGGVRSAGSQQPRRLPSSPRQPLRPGQPCACSSAGCAAAGRGARGAHGVPACGRSAGPQIYGRAAAGGDRWRGPARVAERWCAPKRAARGLHRLLRCACMHRHRSCSGMPSIDACACPRGVAHARSRCKKCRGAGVG